MASKQIYPYQGNEPYVFISYSHKDSAEVLDLIDLLQNRGYRIWYDEGIKPGTEWDDFIAEHIHQCAFFLACISKNYLDSDNCRDELNYVREIGKARLLVYFENIELPPGMKMRLGRLQAIHKYTYSNTDLLLKKLEETQGLEICCNRQAPREQAPINKATEKENTTKASGYEEKTAENTQSRGSHPLAKASIGDLVRFGHFDSRNIWIILDKQDGKLLLLSKYAVCMKAYNDKNEKITWEKCTLRSWLNGPYLSAAFNGIEQSRIADTLNNNSITNLTNNTLRHDNGGNNTIDKVFLLSIDEAKKYLTSDNVKKTALHDGNVAVAWWLRSPGIFDNFASFVSHSSNVDFSSGYVNMVHTAVRPALWLDISDL